MFFLSILGTFRPYLRCKVPNCHVLPFLSGFHLRGSPTAPTIDKIINGALAVSPARIMLSYNTPPSPGRLSSVLSLAVRRSSFPAAIFFFFYVFPCAIGFDCMAKGILDRAPSGICIMPALGYLEVCPLVDFDPLAVEGPNSGF